MSDNYRVDPSALTDFCTDVFVGAGINPRDARLSAATPR